MNPKQNAEILMGFVGLCALFIMIILYFIMLNQEKRNRDLLIAYNLERLSMELVELARSGIDEAIFKEVEGLNGFGLYNSNGLPLFKVKNAPDSILLESFLPSRSIIINDSKTFIRLIRPLGPPPGHHKKHMKVTPSSNFPKRNIILFIEMEQSKLIGNNISSVLITLILPIVFITLTLSFYMLYIKNRSYLLKIEEQKRLVELGEASRTLAHEIKNPLSAIKLQTAILRKNSDLRDDNEVKIIDEEVTRLDILVERIKDFIKDPKGIPVKIALKPELDNITTKFNYPIEIIGDETIHICIDKSRFRSIIENIIKNSIESGTEETKSAPISILICKNLNNPRKILIQIKDRGIGLTNVDIKKIFDPYYTTKTNGSGIGLTIVKRFVEAANGTIKIEESHDTRGTIVSLVFPLS